MPTPAPAAMASPLRPARDDDGDFDLSVILSCCGATPPPTASRDSTGRDAEHQLTLLQQIERSAICRPPMNTAIADLTASAAQQSLALASQWARLASEGGDLRLLNTACKLLGAVWVASRRHHSSDPTDPWNSLAEPLADAAQHIQTATDHLAEQLAERLILPADAAAAVHENLAEPFAHNGSAHRPAPRIVVLAATGSGGARRYLAAAGAARLPIAATYWYGQPSSSDAAPARASSYADAWYPPNTDSELASPLVATVAQMIPQQQAETWDALLTAFQDDPPDLVVLLGMPIVPPQVLAAARLGIVNAHNGALPRYRGMDAVAWALLHNDPLVCTAHLARPAVDQGEILASHPVPVAPLGTLRRRVKDTQLRLLLAVTAHVAATGRLPSATPQAGDGGRLFHRMHPHLKRILDASPYGVPTHTGTTRTET